MSCMLTDHWPLFGLRVRTPRLELRVPDLDDLTALADLAIEGVHDPATMPFTVGWTDAEPAERGRRVFQYHVGIWSQWHPENWSLHLVTVLDGRVVGTQGMNAGQFGILREVGTGSWLGQKFQGQGIGTEMRAAILHLAFAGLGAEFALSAANLDNPASLTVSRKLGYLEDGFERHAIRGTSVTQQRFLMDRPTWEATRTVPVTIDGLEPCRQLFGLT
jgi:RimJ/RimL family protein N-acetyltransferase